MEFRDTHTSRKADGRPETSDNQGFDAVDAECRKVWLVTSHRPAVPVPMERGSTWLIDIVPGEHGSALADQRLCGMPSNWEVDRCVARTRELLRARGYSRRTGDIYAGWLKRFLLRNRNTSARRLSRTDVERFLAHLTDAESLAPKSRNQASSALAFFFREVLRRDELDGMPRAREPKRIPTVLSHRQVSLVLGELEGKYRLLASLMYGAGLRLSEAHQLRIKDVDFDLGQIAVRDGKGSKDRWVLFPERLVPPMRDQIETVERIHESDCRRGGGWAPLPGALSRKDPAAGYELAWQLIFPAGRWSKDPTTQRFGRRYLSPSATQRKVKAAGRACRITKPVTCHTLRRSFATQMLRSGYDVRTVQKLMGHRDVRTTMLYVEAVTNAGPGMRSPLDLDDGRH